jgi:thiamin-phosphate kinase
VRSPSPSRGGSSEPDFIAALRALATHPAARGLLDDAAVLELGPDPPRPHPRHDRRRRPLPQRDPPEDVAWKLVAVNLSDLAAKGAVPVGLLAGYTLSPDAEWNAAFVRGLGEAIAAFDAPLLGGDTVSVLPGTPRSFGLTAIGRADGPVPSRSGARPGDTLYVTGTIGDGGAGLRAALGQLDSPALLARYRRPQPRLAAGQTLAPHVSAMMDVSDGLLIDAARMAEASGLGLEIHLDRVPLSPDTIAACGDTLQSRIDAAIAGDDYELLFAARDIQLPAPSVPMTAIGRFHPEPGLEPALQGRTGQLSGPARLGASRLRHSSLRGAKRRSDPAELPPHWIASPLARSDGSGRLELWRPRHARCFPATSPAPRPFQMVASASGGPYSRSTSGALALGAPMLRPDRAPAPPGPVNRGKTHMNVVLIAIVCGFAAVLYGLFTSRQVLAMSAGNQKMVDIAGAIQEGAKAYLGRQYTTIAMVGVVVAVLVGVFLGLTEAVGFVIGAVLSGVAGYIGMNISVRANVRTAEAARVSLQSGLTTAFRAGAITGMLVAGLALLAIAGLFYYLVEVAGQAPDSREVVDALVSLAFGASLISIFARLGGGIFTKAADVGADLVGKVEAGIPEDDPRNPAVIADNVGDNVGDCAGMAADLFETYVVTVGATMVLIALLVAGAAEQLTALMSLPLIIGGVCILTSIIGTYFVRLGSKQSIMGALYKGFWVTAILSIPAIYYVMSQTLGDMNAVIGSAREATGPEVEGQVAREAVAGGFTGMDLFWSCLVGLAVTAGSGLDHRILYRHQLPPGPLDRQGVGHRSRHQRHPGPRHQP